MMYHSFDTLDVAKSFIVSGMKTETAEAVARAIATSRDTDLSHFTNKSDLMEMENKLEKQALGIQAEILKVESRISLEVEKVRGEIERSRNDTIRWVVGTAIAYFASTAGIVTLIVKLFTH